MYRMLNHATTNRQPNPSGGIDLGAGEIRIPMLDGYRHGSVWIATEATAPKNVEVKSRLTGVTHTYTLARMEEPHHEFKHTLCYVWQGSDELMMAGD